MWAEYLEIKGHQVTSCGSLKALREYLETNPKADLAFVDWSLPDASGDQAVAVLHTALPDCKVVAATGMGPAAAQLTGVHHVLSKPFKITRLHDVVVELTGDAS